MAINYRRLGKSPMALTSVVLGALVTGLMIALGSILPTQALSVGIAVGMVVVMMALTRQLQGPALEAHRAAGGKVGSSAIGWIVGLIFLVLIVGAIFLWVFLTPTIEGTKLTVGTNDELFYSGTATESEARALGQQLQEIKFFTDRGVSVKFARDPGGTVLGFVVNEGVWDDPDMLKSFEEVVRQLAPTIGGLPINIQLMDVAGEVKKEWVARD